jgi:sugar phosphate isomerase/epimerase
MINNSTNINNDISHQIIEHRKEPNHDIRNPGPDLVHAHICGNRKCIIHKENHYRQDNILIPSPNISS